ncbi:MAG: leucyl aminopeptidase [Desulfofustis sp.]|nr:leucyl aminopeptidase [Desulfofustis sp.]
MKGTKVRVLGPQAASHPCSLVVFFAAEQKSATPICDESIAGLVAELCTLGDYKGKKEETVLLYLQHTPLAEHFAAKRLLLVGLGEINEETSPVDLRERLRCAGGVIAATARQAKADSLLIVMPHFLTSVPAGGAEQLCEGILLGDYQFAKYKKKDPEDPPFPGIEELIFLSTEKKIIEKAVKRAVIAADAVLTARDMAHEPGSNWTPQHFADFARDLGKTQGMKCTILGKSHLQKAGMGGILAVNRGSAVAPRLIILEYTPQKYSRTLLLVGKGITFDSGGVSLKPAAGMQDMKYDMCGGAAVLAVMQAVAVEKPRMRIIAAVPATDNMSGAAALKPGDIITHYNGTTTEVVNTDAEGRLILADALAYGIEKFRPDCVVDLATLTGAVIIGLGHHRTGLFSNHDQLAALIQTLGDMAGEPYWRLPLGPEYSKQIESDVADIKNIGGKEAGAITAAAFLEKFVGDTPWVHLDIAGTAWDFTKKAYIPKGPSGIGVRTLIELIRNPKDLDWS